MKAIFNNTKQYFKNHPMFGEFILLAFIFTVSLFIRRIGLKFGFPILTHADETYILNPVLSMTQRHSLDPNIYFRPDHILQYLNLIYLNLVSFIAYGENVYWAFEEHYLTFYFYSRLLVAVLGSLIPVLAYKIGKEIQPKVALPAAIVFATFPLYIQYSVYITPDIPITLFSMVVIYFSLRYVNTHQQKFLIFATIFAAINTAEKYPGLLSLLIVFTAIGFHIFNNDTASRKELIQKFILQSIKFALVYILALFIVAPFLFIKIESVIEALIYETRTVHLGADNLGWFGNMWFYIKLHYKNIGLLGAILFAIGLISSFKSMEKNKLFLLYGFFYFGALSMLALHWERWSLPMHISPLFMIAIGITYLWEKRKQNQGLKVFGILLIGLFVAHQTIFAIYTPMRMKFTDTRLVSLTFCESKGITPENTLYEGYTPFQTRYFKVIFSEYTAENDENDENEYIILSSSMFGRYEAEPERYQDQVRIYDKIREENVLIEEFHPTPPATNTLTRMENILYFLRARLGLIDEVRYSGPTIEIYKISN